MGFGTSFEPHLPPKACKTDADCPATAAPMEVGSSSGPLPQAPKACKTDADCPSDYLFIYTCIDQICEKTNYNFP
ncbi:hypothetical protein P8452_51687 [Trifolium repens]|nr:hypothetical protein P8452_51687 [Trifolium repens]